MGGLCGSRRYLAAPCGGSCQLRNSRHVRGLLGGLAEWAGCADRGGTSRLPRPFVPAFGCSLPRPFVSTVWSLFVAALGRLLPRPFVSTCWGFSSSSLPRPFVSRFWPFCHRAVPFSSFASSATGIFCYRHLFPGSLAQSSTIDGHRLPVRLGLALAVVLRLLRRYLASPLDGGLPTVPLSPFLRAFGRPSGCWVVLEQPLDNATWCEWVGYVPG